jgi:hypothetical protein
MKVLPLTVGGLAGGTVYPRSPLRTVPAPAVNVLARIAKLLTPVRSSGPAAVTPCIEKNITEIMVTTRGRIRIFFIVVTIKSLIVDNAIKPRLQLC